MATDPFIQMAEEMEADAAARKQAATTGQSNARIQGSAKIYPTVTEQPPSFPNIQGGEPIPAEPEIAPPISSLPYSRSGYRRTVEATIPDEARDPFILMAEKMEREAENTARSPDFSKGDKNFLDRSLSRMGSGFNAAVADMIGNSIEFAEEGLRPLGVSIIDNPKTAKKQVHDWMKSQGLKSGRVSGVAGAIGEAGPEVIITAAALITGVGPLMAGAGHGTKVARFFTMMGDLIAKYPGLVVAQELGSVLGARTATEGARDLGMGEAGQMGMGFTGAVLGGNVANVVKGGVRTVGKIFGIGRSRDTFVAPGSLPIREAVDAETAKIIGERMIAGERAVLERTVKTSIEDAANLSIRDPGMASTQVVRALDDASDMGRGMERVAWGNTRHAKAVVAPTDDVHDLFTTLRVEAVAHNRSNTLPIAIMEKFEADNLTAAVQAAPSRPTGVLGPNGAPGMTPGTPAVAAAPRNTTIGHLLGTHSDIVKAIAHERRAPARGLDINSELIRVLARIDERVLDVVARTLPTDTTIAAARTMSRDYNEMFTQGVVAQIRGMVGRNEVLVPPELAVSKILKQFGGSDQIARIGRDNPMGPTVRASFEQAVRSEFREIAQTLGAPGAADFMRRIDPSIRGLATLRGELMQASDDLTALAQTRKTLDASALAKFSAKDSDAGIRSLMADPNSPMEARAIMKVLGADPTAVQAFKTGVVDYFMRVSHGAPGTIQEQLKNPRIARTMKEIFTTPENARFNRIVDFGARIERGDETLLQKFRRGGLPVFGAILGARAGGTINKFMGGTHNIQTPGLIAGVTRRWVKDMWAGLDINELMARAVLSPRWERILMSRVPETTKEQRKYLYGIKTLIRVENAAMATKWNPKKEEEE